MTRSFLLSIVQNVGRKTEKGNLLVTWNEFRAIMAVEYSRKQREIEFKTFVSEVYSELKRTGYASAFKSKKTGEVLVIFKVPVEKDGKSYFED